MLPPPLFSAYRQYKEDTDAVASWLASTAKAHGYPAHLLTNPAQRGPGRLKAKARKAQKAVKYTVAIRDFVPLAEWIASKQPPVAVPSAFASAINRVIKTRSKFVVRMAGRGTADSDEDDSTQRHTYFLGILEKVRQVLKPRMPAGAVGSAGESAKSEPPVNMFAALQVEEPSDETPVLPPERPTVGEAEDNTIYEAEAQTDILDAYPVYLMMCTDLDYIRRQIRCIWLNYKDGVFGAAAAAVATNAAIDLARNLIDEVLPALGPHDIWGLALKFYYGCCVAKGFDRRDLLDAEKQLNPATYDIQNDLYIAAYLFLLELVGLLPHEFAVYDGGASYTYDPRRDRSKMSGRERFEEDRTLVYEMFTELLAVARLVYDYPVQDEFLRGVKEMDQTRKVPFYLVFSVQVFLDIHHNLREAASRPFGEMSEEMAMMAASIRAQTEFHKGDKLETWSASNERAMQDVASRINWVNRDPVFKVKQKAATRAGLSLDETVHRNRILRSSPVLAGLMLFHFRALLNELGLAVANAFGSIASTWHLYNAALGEKLLTQDWDDMDFLYSALGSSSFHVGEAPKDTLEYLVRFCLQTGVSAAAFIGQKQQGRPSKFASRAGPRMLKRGAPVSNMFTDRYVRNSGQFDWTPEYLDEIISRGEWRTSGAAEEGTLRMTRIGGASGSRKNPAGPRRKPSVGGGLRAESLVQSLVFALHAETPEFSFPYLAMHRRCWQLLRDVRKHCSSLLHLKYTPACMVREAALPWVVGYIFIAAAGSADGSTQTKDMRLLERAARCLHDVIADSPDEMIRPMVEHNGLRRGPRVGDEPDVAH